MRIAIEGIGVVGAFGCGAGDMEKALETGESPVTNIPLDTPEGTREFPVFAADTARLEEFVPKRALRRIDHYSKMALLGSYLALQDAGRLEADRQRMGVVIATGYGATRTTFAFLDSVMDGGDACASPTHFSNSVHNAAAANVSILLKAEGPSLTVSQFEMSVPSALLSARQWLAEGRVDTVLFGCVDEYCDVLGYCWQRFFREDGGGRICPFDFERQSAMAGEGAAFFLLGRDEGQKARYGYIQDVFLGSGAAQKPSLPDNALFFLGADGHKKCGSHYPEQVPSGAEAVSYAPLYGSLPVGTGFDLAVGALSLRNDKVYPSPSVCSDRGLWSVPQKVEALGSRPICCLKIGAEGEFGMFVLSRD